MPRTIKRSKIDFNDKPFSLKSLNGHQINLYNRKDTQKEESRFFPVLPDEKICLYYGN